MGSGIILNAQSALLQHEYMPRDVCATHPLYHRLHFVPIAMPVFCRTLLQFTEVMNLMNVANVSKYTICIHAKVCNTERMIKIRQYLFAKVMLK